MTTVLIEMALSSNIIMTREVSCHKCLNLVPLCLYNRELHPLHTSLVKIELERSYRFSCSDVHNKCEHTNVSFVNRR